MAAVVHFLPLRCQINFCWISNDKDLSGRLLISFGCGLCRFQISRTQIVMDIQSILYYCVVVCLTRGGAVPRFFSCALCIRYLLYHLSWLSSVGGRLGSFDFEELVFRCWFESVALDLFLVFWQFYRQEFNWVIDCFRERLLERTILILGNSKSNGPLAQLSLHLEFVDWVTRYLGGRLCALIMLSRVQSFCKYTLSVSLVFWRGKCRHHIRLHLLNTLFLGLVVYCSRLWQSFRLGVVIHLGVVVLHLREKLLLQIRHK